jgi:hypothetical protein
MRRTALFATIGFVALGCGFEDIELGAGARDGGASTIDGGGHDATALEDVTSPPGDGGGCDVGPAPSSCHGLDDTCAADRDCCSTRCDHGKCIAPGKCGGAGATCATRADCCSGMCEPAATGPGRTCLAQCAPSGASCTRASDCCGLDCNDGVCSGTVCAIQGEACTSAAQCCSNTYDPASKKCQIPPGPSCRPAGEDCTGAAKGACCGKCDDGTNRCDIGPGPCRLPGSVCLKAADCCVGDCADNGTGLKTCAPTACVESDASDAGCNAGFECCSGACLGNPAQCTTACTPAGSACTSAGACCSGSCAEGVCQAPTCSGPPK